MVVDGGWMEEVRGETLVKGHQVSLCRMNSWGDSVYSMVTIGDNTVLDT